MSEEIKVSEMQEAKEINDEDLLMLIQKNANKKVTIRQIKNLFKIIDNLTSVSTIDALSAKQGKILNDKITNTNTYSTEEVNTGKKWIDGKDIYRKVIELSNIPASTTEYSYNVENIDKIVNAQASWYDTLDKATFVTNLRYDGTGAYIKFIYLKSKFKIETKYNWSERTSDVYVIIEYTKTV